MTISKISKEYQEDILQKITAGRAFIDGKYVQTQEQQIISKQSPIDGAILPDIASCQQNDVDRAVQCARSTYLSRVWCDKEPSEKKEILYNLAELMRNNLEELAILDTIETGRSIKNYFYDSIPKAIKAVQWFAEATDKFYNHAISMRASSFATITKEPLGVVGIITPWNDPLVVACWKFVPALLMGNSVILKPAEQSSYSILRVAQLAKKAGIPDGVFNVLPGYGETTGKALACHNNVDGIFFTGSTEIGKQILIYAGQSNMKKVGLECGGKSPFIISDSCNRIEQAVKILAKNIFYNQGQICSAPSRLLVFPDVKEKVLKLLAKESCKYIPNDPFNIESEVGCLVSDEQRQRIEEFIVEGKKSGCRQIKILSNSSSMPYKNSIMPTIFADVDIDSSFAKKEIFGPVLCVINVNIFFEAIKIANDSCYGLAASIWTDNIDEAYQASRLLEAGIVHINSYGEDDNSVPFGGYKESGLGKDKSLYAFEEYSRTKTVWSSFKNIAEL